MARQFDLRLAINCVSDVVFNRPAPIREFDQIYMKVADMVIQAHYVSERFDGLDVVFIGDGDAIALCTMHLKHQRVFDHGPARVKVLDFDERIVTSITRFAEKYEFGDRVSAQLYNVVDPLPTTEFAAYDAFYTNPPWGKSNGGESVAIFLERGIESCRSSAQGILVIADDQTLSWTQEVLYSSQRRASDLGFVVAEMMPGVHAYHLDDAPDLRSCTCLFRRVHSNLAPNQSRAVDHSRLQNFYGRSAPLKIRYVRELPTLNYGRASDPGYAIDLLE